MNTQIFNPFLISGYESPSYFCDREEETNDIIETLRNGRNITLTSPRRIGKTGLIKHTFYRLKQLDAKAICIYIDLFPTNSLADFTRSFSSSVLGQLDSDPAKMLKKMADVFKGLRPTMTFDELSGRPKFGVEIAKGGEEHTLDQIFEYLKRSGKACVIAFDEFQQIAAYPEKNVEALLRSYIQDLHNVRFIFSGSQSHMLREMFLSPQRPFYQSTSEKNIGAIPERAYYLFASEFFHSQGRQLPEEVFHNLYARYEGYTWYVQMLLNRMYAKSGRMLDDELLQECVGDILRENDYYYQQLFRSFSAGQKSLAKAIASEKLVKEITSGAFISKYGLTATSSVKGALKVLLDQEIVYPSNDGYIIYDRFFAEWLRATFC